MSNIAEFDAMVLRIVKFCEREGIAPEHVARCSKPLFDKVNKAPRGKYTLAGLASVLALLGILAFVTRMETVQRSSEAVLRIAAIKVRRQKERGNKKPRKRFMYSTSGETIKADFSFRPLGCTTGRNCTTPIAYGRTQLPNSNILTAW